MIDWENMAKIGAIVAAFFIAVMVAVMVMLDSPKDILQQNYQIGTECPMCGRK